MNGTLSDEPMGTASSMADALVHKLIRAGVLQDHHWRDALTALPRHRFVTDFYEPDEAGWRHVTAKGRGFVKAVCSGRALVTAVSPPDPWGHQIPVSVSPTTELQMWSLQALGLHDGATALELGTGTGHSAAMLAHRLGADRVITVEIDPDLRDRATHTLHGLGIQPRLLLADSMSLGSATPPVAPVDRVLVSHEVPTIPPGWAELMRPDGAMLVRISGGLNAGGHVLLLRPPGSTATLSGRFLGWAGTLSPYRAPTRLPTAALAGRRSVPLSQWPICSGDTPHPPDALTAPGVGTLALLAQLHLPPGTTAARRAVPAESTDPASVTHLAAPDGSWVQIRHTPDRYGRHETRWAGPTRLLAAVSAAHRVHHDLGAPSIESFGLTATPHGTVIWHGDPHTGPRWPLPDLLDLPDLPATPPQTGGAG